MFRELHRFFNNLEHSKLVGILKSKLLFYLLNSLSLIQIKN